MERKIGTSFKLEEELTKVGVAEFQPRGICLLDFILEGMQVIIPEQGKRNLKSYSKSLHLM